MGVHRFVAAGEEVKNDKNHIDPEKFFEIHIKHIKNLTCLYYHDIFLKIIVNVYYKKAKNGIY